ncbi:MAG: GTPase, partial [Ruminococcus sp.]|nr:GTPase [Ruminococcus sp.]
MSLNSTPSGERVHIGFFGRRNAGKSSVVNAVTNQQISVVSDVKGTTTDPVQKAMELLPLGPVMIIDTPGFDDEGSLGEQRVKRAKQVLNRTDIAVLVVDGNAGKTAADEELIGIFKQKNIPYIVAYNKCDEAGVREYDDGIAV